MGIDEVGLVEVNLGEVMGIEDCVAVDLFADTDDEKWALLVDFGPDREWCGYYGPLRRSRPPLP